MMSHMRVHARQRTSAFVTLAAAIAAALSPAAHADKVHFDIASGPAQQTLSQFISQTGLQLLFDFEAVKGLTTRAVSGDLEARDALAQMLQDTGFMFEFVNERTVAIVKPGTAAKPAASTTRAGEYTRLAQADVSSSRSSAVPVSAGDTGDYRSQNSSKADAPSSRIELEEIVVTGTHIHGATIDGPSPVVIYDRQQLDRSGASNLSDFVARLPQSVSSPVTDTAAATWDGSRAVNLRGLGAGATLVLVNGRRQQIGAASQRSSNNENSANLNVIPFGAVERVEVLTDGGSAIYGSDAVGGIVNVILRKDFTGFESRSRYGNTTRQDLQEISQSFLGGFSKEKLSVLFSADYFDREALLVADRDSALAALRAAASPAAAAAAPSVPANIFAVSGNLPGLNSNAAGVPRGQDGANLTPASFSTTLNPFLPSSSLTTLYTPQERKGGYVGLRYGATDNLALFLDGSITHLKNRYEQPATFSRVRVPAANPFNPFGVDVLASFYFPHSGSNTTVTDDYSATAGFDFRFSNRLRFDGYLAWSRSDADTYSYDIDSTAMATALARTDRSTALNVFGDRLVNRPSVMAEIVRSTSQVGEMSSSTAGAKTEIALLQLPAGDLKAVLGGERRKEDHRFIAISGQTMPFSVLAEYSPEREIDSAFAELAVPLLRDRLGLKAADLSLAGRYDDYSDFGESSNPQVGLTVRPLRALLLRATWGTSFIAPSFSQSFVPERSQQLPVLPQLAIFDPVLNQTYNFPTLISGGNPDLIPQSADTLSAGFVLEPPALEALRFTLNWFRIKYDDKITFLSFRDLVPLESLFPENITRDPANGNRIVSVRQGPVNVSRVETSGVDANVSYRFVTGIGEFDAGLAATHVFHYRSQVTPVTSVTDLVGTARNPKSWEGSGSLFYTRGGFSVGSRVRYVDAYTRISGATTFRLSPMTIVSTQASYTYTPRSSGGLLFKSLQLAAGLENAFDEEPSADGEAWGFDFTEGDLRGRQYYLTFDARF